MAGEGVTATGFVSKTQEEILTELVASMTGTLGPTLNTTPTGPIGQILGIFSRQQAVGWELLQLAYEAFDPDKAEFYLLDALCALIGVTREPATSSLCKNVLVNLNAGVTLAAGSVANVDGQPNVRFASVTAVHNAATGATNVAVDFECLVTGPIPCYANTLTVIPSAVSGWNTVTNPTDANLGTNQETDTALRKRRKAELTRPGATTVSSIRADLLELEDVTQVFVFENTTSATNGDGLPPHSFEAVVYDGLTPAVANNVIAQTVWDSKAAGIRTWGATSGTCADDLGDTQTVYFSRPTVKPVYMTISIEADPETFPLDGVDQVKQAIKDKGDVTLELGTDVVSLFYKSAAITVEGVLDAPTLYLGFLTGPTGTSNLTIGGREQAQLDTTRITVNIL